MESIPQIPIHVTEIKKLIIKDNLNAKSMTSENDLNEERLLSVLTHGSTGRNPTFFKAYGHNDVFGLRVAIPEGCTTLEVTETLPSEDPGGEEEIEAGGSSNENQNVLYVRLPEGHPIITGASDQPVPPSSIECDNSLETKMSSIDESLETTPVVSLEGKAAAVQPSLSFEEAVEQAELIFDDGENMDDTAQMSVDEMKNAPSSLILHSSSDAETMVSESVSTDPDLKLEPVLSMTNASSSKSSLSSTSNASPTAKPSLSVTNHLIIEEKDLNSKSITGNEDLLNRNGEGCVDSNLTVTPQTKKDEKARENKGLMTIVQVQQQCNSSNERIEHGVKSELGKQVLNNESAPKTRHRKIESGQNQTLVTNSKTMPSSSVVLKKESSKSASVKVSTESFATEEISITVKERLASPVNKNSKVILEVGKRKPESEVKSMSNSSAMVMINVEDEINADGATIVNQNFNKMIDQQHATIDEKPNVDATDSRRKEVKIKEEILNSVQVVSASESSRHHNLRPKRTLRHVHALKQQAKRRKRNTSIAAAAASSGASSSTNISNSPDPSTISIQRTVSRKTSIGKDNGGKF